MDAVADHSRFVVALDIVARDRATGRTDAGHRRPAETVAELVAHDASEHAADDRARARALRSLAHGLDRRDRADSLARHGGRLHRGHCGWRRGHRLGLRRTVLVRTGWSGGRNRRVLGRRRMPVRRWRRVGRRRGDGHRWRRRVRRCRRERGGRGLRRRHRAADASRVGRHGERRCRSGGNRRRVRLRRNGGRATRQRRLVARAAGGERRCRDRGDESAGREVARSHAPK